MIDTLLALLAPHYCSGCRKVGSALCENCKYDIICEPYAACVLCADTRVLRDGVCSGCQRHFQRAWCAGERQGSLQRAIGGYKFQRMRQTARPLVEVLDATLPELPPATIIVPIPTVAAHIRQRGYDHTRLLATGLARRRQLAVDPALVRRTSQTQRGATRTQRETQAAAAFTARGPLASDIPYLLLDDVVTTGATVRHAAAALRAAGAQEIWLATLSRQSLD